jgi:hypothetical protein
VENVFLFSIFSMASFCHLLTSLDGVLLHLNPESAPLRNPAQRSRQAKAPNPARSLS